MRFEWLMQVYVYDNDIHIETTFGWTDSNSYWWHPWLILKLFTFWWNVVYLSFDGEREVEEWGSAELSCVEETSLTTDLECQPWVSMWFVGNWMFSPDVTLISHNQVRSHETWQEISQDDNKVSSEMSTLAQLSPARSLGDFSSISGYFISRLSQSDAGKFDFTLEQILYLCNIEPQHCATLIHTLDSALGNI